MFSGLQRRLSVEDRMENQFKTRKQDTTKFREVDLNQTYSEETQALYDAAKAGNLSKVKSMLSKGANPNWYNNHDGGITSLHCACEIGQTEIVAALLQAGAEVSVVNIADYNTPLHVAVYNGRADVVRQLVQHDSSVAHIDRENAYGNTPLHEAATVGNADIVKFLASCEGIDINHVNHRGSTPIMFALFSEKCSTAVLSAFIEGGADLTKTDEDGVSLIHVCAIRNNEAALKYLISKGADAKAKDNNGRTAIFYAEIKDHKNIISILENSS